MRFTEANKSIIEAKAKYTPIDWPIKHPKHPVSGTLMCRV
jgi:hypothetical protein